MSADRPRCPVCQQEYMEPTGYCGCDFGGAGRRLAVDETAMARALDNASHAVAGAVRSIEGLAALADGALSPDDAADALLLAATRRLLRVHGIAGAAKRLRAVAVVIERADRQAVSADDVEGVPG